MDSTTTNTRKYADKEEFVTGHDGTTPHEILLQCLVIPIGLHLYYKFHNAYFIHNNHIVADVILEFWTLIIPMLLVQTNLMSYQTGPLILLVVMITFVYMTYGNKTDQVSIQEHYKPAYLTVHRASVYILTTIAILAVDFPIFPRKYCKTETSGYGLMDIGASSFIIIAGWTSALSSAKSSVVADSGSEKGVSITTLANKAIKKCAPLLIIGLIRLATNKGIEYQEHVSEYGVHWNFFFTLCCVEGIMVIWKGIVRKYYEKDGMLALVLMVSYQLYLTKGGGQEFIENGERTCANDGSFLCNAFVANREGILGVVGYLTLRLLSEAIARFCLLPSHEILQGLWEQAQSDDRVKKVSDNMTSEQRKQVMLLAIVAMKLLSMSLVLWAAHFFLTVGLNIPNSRRSTNAAFILWSLAHNVTLLFMIHYVVPSISVGSHIPRILEAVNRHGLAVFLSSNILTGLVNLTVDTLHASDAKAMLVLVIYLTSVCGFALLLGGIFTKNKKD